MNFGMLWALIIYVFLHKHFIKLGMAMVDWSTYRKLNNRLAVCDITDMAYMDIISMFSTSMQTKKIHGHHASE